jgi:cell wall-associated NlpC family hydrolase
MKKIFRVLVLLVSLAVFVGTVGAAEPEGTPTPTPKPKSFFGKLNPFAGKKQEKRTKSRKTPPPASTASADLAVATPTATPSPTSTPRQTPAPNATISAQEIADFDSNSAQIRGIIDNALGLTSLNLDYRYGSADPVNGGMDCSGFVFYILTKCGVRDVPRDARDQYVWVRKSGSFQAVLAQSDDTFELNSLRPGDLLFWGNTSSSNPEPAIAETMIYVGREKSTGQRIMVGATDGRIYKGQPRSGVSIVDFKVLPSKKSDEDSTPTFVGYGRVPGLAEQ